MVRAPQDRIEKHCSKWWEKPTGCNLHLDILMICLNYSYSYVCLINLLTFPGYSLSYLSPSIRSPACLRAVISISIGTATSKNAHKSSWYDSDCGFCDKMLTNKQCKWACMLCHLKPALFLFCPFASCNFLVLLNWSPPVLFWYCTTCGPKHLHIELLNNESHALCHTDWWRSSCCWQTWRLPIRSTAHTQI